MVRRALVAILTQRSCLKSASICGFSSRRITSTLQRNRQALRTMVLITTLLGLVVGVGVKPAYAAERHSSGTAVLPCTAGSFRAITTVTATKAGRLAFRQSRSSHGNSPTRVYAVSATGMRVSDRVVQDGGVAVWSGQPAGRYTFYGSRNVSRNCNNLLPGNGTYTTNYTVYYQVR
jgi:hypothetical protein